jgi:hypothetical protein|tara:strand:- start:110 stop:376 length:267 start_codon:yes stop_codon:yes gene_type:complete
MFPFTSITESTLGGRTSTFIKVSSEFQDEWQNGIFHNSPYGIFHLYPEKGVLKLELTSKGLNTPKFRKCKCEDQLTALSKIRKWMDKF